MPLGADTLIVEHLADDLSAEFGICVAPTLEYGVNVATERGFPGNASLRKKTLHRMLNDLLDTWESTGVMEFILLTAHEHDPHQEALATVITTRARVRVVAGFFVEGDYQYTNYEYPIAGGGTTRSTYDSFLAGAGYAFPLGGHVGLYASALYDFGYDGNDITRPYDSPVRYQVGVSVGF
jgi:hypothetical protein